MRRIGWLLFSTILVISGCVYYNTFFNAEQYFTQAQEMELRENGRPTASAIQNYNNAIKKCGIVLTDYKDSKYADDALFLMARCFYYIGRNYTQAIKHFEDLIEFYPESEFVPDAKLYIARCKYAFHRQEEAYTLLRDFLQDTSMKDHFPKALKILADFHLEEKDYVSADYYLNRIIENFPKSDEFENAFFLKGKARHEAGNYIASNEVFHSLLKSRLPKNMKLDARYYIALNSVLLEKYADGLKISNALLKDEYRENHISRIQLLKARSLSGLQRNEEAIKLFEAIIADNKRSELAAEASFFLAELYFNNLHNYDKAIENYNNVKIEYNQSKYVNEAVTKSAVASQIIQFNNPNTNLSAEELVLQQFKLAEFYIEVLNLPDSALIVYDHIISQKSNLETRLDSLLTRFAEENSVLDSLHTILARKNDSLQITLPDTLAANETVSGDSLITQIIPEEKTAPNLEVVSPIDTTEVFANTDSLASTSVSDSVLTPELTLQDLLIQQESLVNSLSINIDRTKEDITKFENEFIPFAKFIKIWLYKNVFQDSTKIEQIYDDLASNLPDNKYTFAAKQLINDEEVKLITKKQQQDLAAYQEALDLLAQQPELAKEKLQNIAADSLNTYYLKANYCLGYIHHFIEQDSAKAKDYYNLVLEKDQENVFKPIINKFYVRNEFHTLSRLPKLIALEEKEKQEKDVESEQADSEEQETKKNEAELTPKKELVAADSIDSLKLKSHVLNKIAEITQNQPDSTASNSKLTIEKIELEDVPSDSTANRDKMKTNPDNTTVLPDSTSAANNKTKTTSLVPVDDNNENSEEQSND